MCAWALFLARLRERGRYVDCRAGVEAASLSARRRCVYRLTSGGTLELYEAQSADRPLHDELCVGPGASWRPIEIEEGTARFCEGAGLQVLISETQISLLGPHDWSEQRYLEVAKQLVPVAHEE